MYFVSHSRAKDHSSFVTVSSVFEQMTNQNCRHRILPNMNDNPIKTRQLIYHTCDRPDIKVFTLVGGGG